jgi:hypothetical protein
VATSKEPARPGQRQSEDGTADSGAKEPRVERGVVFEDGAVILTEDVEYEVDPEPHFSGEVEIQLSWSAHKVNDYELSLCAFSLTPESEVPSAYFFVNRIHKKSDDMAVTFVEHLNHPTGLKTEVVKINLEDVVDRIV